MTDSLFFKSKLFMFFLFISMSLQVNLYEIMAKLTTDYFHYHLVTQFVVFGCYNSYDRVQLMKSLIKPNDFNYVTYINIENNLNMAPILKVNYYKLGIYLDLECPYSKIIFDQFWDQGLRYNESYFWLIRSSEHSAPDYFHQLPLNIAVEITLAFKNHSDDEYYLLFDVYNPSFRHGGKLNITFMGKWSFTQGLNVELTQYKYKRRGNLHGLLLNASIAIPFESIPDIDDSIKNPVDRHIHTIHRFNYELTLQLSDYYNFTMNVSRSDTWGYLINGTFNGVIGEIVKGIVDIGISPMQHKPERYDVIEWTVQTWLIQPRFILRHPERNNLNNPFLKPLEQEAWYCIGVFGVLIWCLLYAIVKIEQKLILYTPVNTLDSHPASETTLITTAAICQQAQSDGPRFNSGRIIFVCLFLWSLMLYQFYSSSIVGSLLSEKSLWINNLEDLAESNLEVGIEDIGYNHDFFATTTDPIALKLYRKKVAVNKKRTQEPYYTPEEGLKKVKAGGYAFHVDIASAYKIIEETFDMNQICDLTEIQMFSPPEVYTVTPKFSPFKKMLIYGIQQIIEKGLANRLRKFWLHQQPSCPESHSEEPTPIAISDFSPAVFLLFFGCIIATSVVILEVITHFRKNYKINNRNKHSLKSVNKRKFSIPSNIPAKKFNAKKFRAIKITSL